MTSTIDQHVDRLRERFMGQVVLPGDEDYDAARAVFNGDINRRPAVIARCASAADVAAAIRFARDRNLEIAVRGGAHNFGGASVCERGMMIHLGDLKAVAVNPTGRVAHCGGGATGADLDAATQEFGLATPIGTVSHTGVGGLTLGGGLGWLSPGHGLAVDNLLSAEVVTADGRVLRASETEHPDLFWGLRGGGGNFGVVTDFEYRLHEVGPIVQLGMFFWDLAHGQEALRLAWQVHERLSRTQGCQIAALNAPPAPFVPERYHFVPGYALLVAGFGGQAEHDELAAEIRAALPPLFDLVTPVPYCALQQTLDDAIPFGTPCYEKSVALDSLSPAVIQVITKQFPGKQSPMTMMPMMPIGGAVRDVPADATAVGTVREAGILVGIAAVATSPELLTADRRLAREMWETLTPYADGLGTYVNFLNDYQEGDRVRASYGVDLYDRLSQVKAAYDPDNVFHRNPNVKPAAH